MMVMLKNDGRPRWSAYFDIIKLQAVIRPTPVRAPRPCPFSRPSSGFGSFELRLQPYSAHHRPEAPMYFRSNSTNREKWIDPRVCSLTRNSCGIHNTLKIILKHPKIFVWISSGGWQNNSVRSALQHSLPSKLSQGYVQSLKKSHLDYVNFFLVETFYPSLLNVVLVKIST